MPELTLPIWVLRRKLDGRAQPGQPLGEPIQFVAFTSMEFASRYMQAYPADAWQVHPVTTDQELMFLASDLHKERASGLCVNPEPDGGGGTAFSLKEVLDMIEKRRGQRRTG